MPNRKKILLYISIIITIYSFGSAERASAATEISSDISVPTTWKKENSPYVVMAAIQVKAPLVIEAGTVVKFTNIFPLPGYAPSLGLESSFAAVGDPLDEIIFTSACDDSYGGDTQKYCSPYNKGKAYAGDWGGIYVDGNINKSTVSLDHVKISYAIYGFKHTSTDLNIHRNVSITRSEIEYCQLAGIYVRNVESEMDELVLERNYYGIEFLNDETNLHLKTKIINSSIFANRYGAYDDAYHGLSDFDARYNWWGDSSGPYYSFYDGLEKNNINGQGNSIIARRTLFRPWDQQDPTIPKEPVIFVPGIGASINPDLMISGILSDNWTMFDHTYDGIIQAFKSMGYVEGKNFFIAYYDWRQSNEDSVKKYLEPLIQKALSQNDTAKVNIVTHSMGSLVARDYVQSDDYASDVDNLIMIAPPNRGSSDVYAAWEGGRIPNNWSGGFFMKIYLSYLTLKTLNTSYYDTIHKYIPSLKELMPTYDYLYRENDAKNFKDHLAMQEKNDFLLDLNTDVDKLNQRTRFSIILGDKQPTVDKIPVIDSDAGGIWSDGKPDPIDPEKDDNGGDGEVLMLSGDVESQFRDVLEYGHSEIVSKSEKIVAERLGDELDWTYDSPQIDNQMDVWTDAPGDLEITAPDGEKVSSDHDGNDDGIDGSIYAQENKKDGFKIASIPNLKKGQYKINLKGSKDGKYHLGMDYSDSKNDIPDKSDVIPISTSDGQTVQAIVSSDNGDSQEPVSGLQTVDTTPPVVTISSPENGKEYYSNEKLQLKLDATDDVTKAENLQWQVYFDDTQIDKDSVLDFSNQAVGQHSVSVYVDDQAGNEGGAESDFSIIDPPPTVADTTEPAENSSQNSSDDNTSNDAPDNAADNIPDNTPPDNTPTNDPIPENSGTVAPTNTPTVTPPARTSVKKKKHYKKKHHKKKEKKSKIIVKKSSAKIKIISSRVNPFPIAKPRLKAKPITEEVLGAADEATKPDIPSSNAPNNPNYERADTAQTKNDRPLIIGLVFLLAVSLSGVFLWKK
jgi:pimeloyl-ACP methyl ester carboxylesterase